jgi:hypothetical protein
MAFEREMGLVSSHFFIESLVAEPVPLDYGTSPTRL